MEPVAVGDIALGDGDEAGQAGLGSQKVVVGRIETAGALGGREAIAEGEDLALPVVEEGEAHAVDESEGARRAPRGASRTHRASGPGPSTPRRGTATSRPPRLDGWRSHLPTRTIRSLL